MSALQKKQMEATTGLLPLVSQAFNIAQISPMTVPPDTTDVLIVRTNPERIHEYINTTSPNKLMELMVLIDTKER